MRNDLGTVISAIGFAFATMGSQLALTRFKEKPNASLSMDFPSDPWLSENDVDEMAAAFDGDHSRKYNLTLRLKEFLSRLSAWAVPMLPLSDPQSVTLQTTCSAK